MLWLLVAFQLLGAALGHDANVGTLSDANQNREYGPASEYFNCNDPSFYVICLVVLGGILGGLLLLAINGCTLRAPSEKKSHHDEENPTNRDEDPRCCPPPDTSCFNETYRCLCCSKQEGDEEPDEQAKDDAAEVKKDVDEILKPILDPLEEELRDEFGLFPSTIAFKIIKAAAKRAMKNNTKIPKKEIEETKVLVKRIMYAVDFLVWEVGRKMLVFLPLVLQGNPPWGAYVFAIDILILLYFGYFGAYCPGSLYNELHALITGKSFDKVFASGDELFCITLTSHNKQEYHLGHSFTFIQKFFLGAQGAFVVVGTASQFVQFTCGTLPFKVVAAATLFNVKHILFGCFGAFLLLISILHFLLALCCYHWVRIAFNCFRGRFEYSWLPEKTGNQPSTKVSCIPDATSYDGEFGISFHWWKLLYEQMERSWVRSTWHALMNALGCAKEKEDDKGVEKKKLGSDDNGQAGEDGNSKPPAVSSSLVALCSPCEQLPPSLRMVPSSADTSSVPPPAEAAAEKVSDVLSGE